MGDGDGVRPVAESFCKVAVRPWWDPSGPVVEPVTSGRPSVLTRALHRMISDERDPR